MASMLENYGLEFLEENEDTLMGFVGHLVKNGSTHMGYYGTPYLFCPMGDAEFWVHTEKTADDGLAVTGFETHCGGRCVWELTYAGFDLTLEDEKRHSRVLMFDNNGLLPMEIITADVLPGLLKGDKVRLQVVALPLEIHYHADEEEYQRTQPEDEKGERWMVGNGSLLPVTFLYNHTPSRYEAGKEYEGDRYIHFCATVKALYHGTFRINEEEEPLFIRCIVNTKYGDLEFNHCITQVAEEERENIRVGAVISGVCVLSGDAAIHEYEGGIVKDMAHHLALFRYTFVKGEAERLRSVLSPSAVYETQAGERFYQGPDAIIERLSYVHAHRNGDYFAHIATITEAAEDAEFPVGTDCIVLAAEEEDRYESIVFLSLDDEGRVQRIKVVTDSRYHFRLVCETPTEEEG